METDQILAKVNCCITGQPLKDCQFINGVAARIYAQWDYPALGNILTKERPKAMGFVHDSCVDPETGKITGELVNVVEFQGDQVIYHRVTDLIAQGYGIPEEAEETDPEIGDDFPWDDEEEDWEEPDWDEE